MGICRTQVICSCHVHGWAHTGTKRAEDRDLQGNSMKTARRQDRVSKEVVSPPKDLQKDHLLQGGLMKGQQRSLESQH